MQLAMAAAEKSLALNAGLSLPYAVTGMIQADEQKDYLTGFENLGKALANDPKNTTAWLWSGILNKGLGYADRAIADFQNCLDIDPGYQNCRQHQAVAYLNNGDTQHAMALFNETIEANFHSQDGPFIPLAVKSGDRMLALYMANQSTGNRYAPVSDWIDALENPDTDHTARLHRFENWVAATGDDIDNFPGILLAFRAYEYFARPNDMQTSESGEIWHSHWAGFRQTPYFKQFVRNSNVLTYWRSAGFPKQCRPAGEDDFECD
jgi:tetratricopeptide (TPR) repeat protein